MKIEIGYATTKNSQKIVPIVDAPHNIRFEHASGNYLFFRLIHFPQKDILGFLSDNEGKEVTITGVYIRAGFGKQGVHTHAVVHYKVKKDVENKGTGVLNCYTITEKERTFLIRAEEEDVIRLVEPYLIELDAVNGARTAAMLRDWFQNWAHPLKLEDVVMTLTEEQKLEAAKVLRDHFAA